MLFILVPVNPTPSNGLVKRGSVRCTCFQILRLLASLALRTSSITLARCSKLSCCADGVSGSLGSTVCSTTGELSVLGATSCFLRERLGLVSFSTVLLLDTEGVLSNWLEVMLSSFPALPVGLLIPK